MSKDSSENLRKLEKPDQLLNEQKIEKTLLRFIKNNLNLGFDICVTVVTPLSAEQVKILGDTGGITVSATESQIFINNPGLQKTIQLSNLDLVKQISLGATASS